MPLNQACTGKEYPPAATDVTAEAVQAYARAYNDDNPAFFDAARPGGIVAPPMFGVVVVWQSVLGAVMDPEVQADVLRLVHGEQDMEFLAPIRPGDRIESTAKIASIETKSTGETMDVRLAAKNQRGQEVLHATFSAFIRSGGRRGAAPHAVEPQKERGAPMLEAEQQIDSDQTFRYADASGDRNPIHVDPNVAKMAGLPGIIVHGLCTMAFTSKVMIDRLCGGDPLRLRRLHVRFSRPVRPGQKITTRVWQGAGRAGRRVFEFETFNPEGQAVIKDGVAEIDA